jgi:hypothetical protein
MLQGNAPTSGFGRIQSLVAIYKGKLVPEMIEAALSQPFEKH